MADENDFASLIAVAKGATINGAYRQRPGAALDAFRADILALTEERIRLRKVLARCALIVERNLGRQDEKVEDVKHIARAELAKRSGA